jgi:hypothetical protein
MNVDNNNKFTLINVFKCKVAKVSFVPDIVRSVLSGKGNSTSPGPLWGSSNEYQGLLPWG